MQRSDSTHLMLPLSAARPLLFLFLAVLSACAPLLGRSQQPPDLHMLELGPASLPAAAAAATGVLLVVNMPWAAPGYDTAAMAYQRQAGQLEYFAFHRWADAPARMLQPLLVQALDRTGAFKAVIQAPSPLRGDLVLASELLKLRQFFAEQGGSSVELGLRVQLRAQDTVLATRVFEKSMPTPTDDPQGGVLAANQLLEKLLPEIAAFCMSQSREVPGRSAD